MSGRVPERDDLPTGLPCVLALNVEEDFFALSQHFGVFIDDSQLVVHDELWGLALESRPLQNGPNVWLRHNVYLGLIRLHRVIIERIYLYGYSVAQRRLLVLVYWVDGGGLLHCIRFNLLLLVNAHIIFFYSCSQFVVDVLLFPLDKFLPDILTVCEMPIFLELLDTFFFNNSLQNVLACRLIVNEGLLLDQVLHSAARSLVDSIAVPQLLIWLLRLLGTFETWH